MFRNVLVPVDGTPPAEHAVPWAVAAAGPAGTVHLAHAHVPPPPVVIEGVVVADPELDQALRDQEAGYLSRLTARVRSVAPDRTVSTWVLDTAEPPADALTRTAAEAAADLVVMATHARGHVARFWHGSVADEVTRRSPVPVLLVRVTDDGPPAELDRRPDLRRLVVPVDGSELAEAVVGPAAALAAGFGAAVTLLLVADGVARAGPAAGGPGGYLQRVAEVVAGRGVEVRSEVVPQGDPAEVILRAAGAQPGTGVAIATHGRAGLSRLVNGSVADAVVRGAAGPVLVFHPPTTEGG